MPKIAVLDERTANQIAAGEVVERPASVVKELVENSLDAGATRIVVEVEGGGRDLIRISDDGCGMSPEDARLSLMRHATSKIRSADDLLAIATMGFRGEAIPSIASVSRFELVTREHDQLAGYRIFVDGGRTVEEGEFGCPPGTRISVRDLFFNVPARLKYLKTNATELGQIGDMLTRLAMANPHVAMRFHSGQMQVFATPGTGQLSDVIAALLGRDVVKELLPVQYQDGHSKVWGFVGRPGAARAGRNHQYFFVNQRAIRTIQVRYAMEEAYAHLLPNGRYPVCVLFIEVPPHEVDVNVHPAKAEVRFEQERDVRGAVYKATRQALGAHLLIPGTTVSEDGEVFVPDRAGEKAAIEARRTGAAPASGAAVPPAPATPPGGGWIPPGASRPGQGGGQATPPPWLTPATTPAPGPAAAPSEPRQVSFRFDGGKTNQRIAEETPSFELPAGGLQAVLERREREGAAPAALAPEALAPAPDEQAWAEVHPPSSGAALIRQLRPLGQVHRSYILCDGPEGLYVMDQHAAHERVFFERLLLASQNAATPIQPLLFPIALDLTPVQMTLWNENASIFTESGFDAEPFGGATLLIKGVPSGLGEAHTARLVSDFLDKLQEEKVPPGTGVLERRKRVLSAMAACKAAIKARDALQPEEIQALMNDLSTCESPHTCPHGRPTIICIGITELEKRFKR
ncbi:MAG TPA: DNA mismatch repair endonuclease MutL [Symbiobacteriaceae bacterium]|nr:DNA mismatch repair endonuclease MutL [Symbiobacteriaceae bacterium]